MNAAAICRVNDWRPGTVLIGKEEYHSGWCEDVIIVTAVGATGILAQAMIRRTGTNTVWQVVGDDYDRSWTLDCRDWRMPTNEEADSFPPDTHIYIHQTKRIIES